VTVAKSIARLTQVSLAEVLLRAVRRARRPPTTSWPSDTTLLSREAANEATRASDHPWLAAPVGALPGRAGHIALIASAQGWVEGFDPRAALAHASSLSSQPVVEACLAVPSWWWFRDGRNRAIARDAFASSLPQKTIMRSAKGTPDGFVATLFEHNRPTMRTMLLDGRLQAAGLLDRAAVERVLADPRPAYGNDYRRIVRLVDVEAWAASWN
jgi:asparagine synthase (glutamine-hydrolysing)